MHVTLMLCGEACGWGGGARLGLVLPERLRLWSNVCFLQTQLPQQRAKCWSKPHQRCRRLQDWGGNEPHAGQTS